MRDTLAMSPLRARFLVLSAAVLFSTGGAAIKATTLTSWQVAGLRSAIAVVAFALFLPGARRMPSRQALFNSLAYAATMIFFVRATKLTTSANAIFLQSTAPIWIVFLAPRLLGEPVRPRDLAFLGVLALGLVLFFLDAPTVQMTAPDPTQGNVIAVLSGIAWAFTIVTLRWLERDEPGASAPALLLGNVITCLICAPLALPFGSIGAADAAAILYLGVFQIGLAYACLTAGVRALPALEASLLLLAEPVLNPIWTFLSHGEVPGGFALVGAAIILVATTVKTVLEAEREATA
ncbi:MAG: DMT family transporter [Candidatus Binatia bacterium]